jgi:hypothetical protein
MKRSFLFLLICLFSFEMAHAQYTEDMGEKKKRKGPKKIVTFKERFISSLGVAYHPFNIGGYTDHHHYGKTSKAGVLALEFSPHVNITNFQTSDFSVSLGTKISLGQNFFGSGTDRTNFFYADFPLLAEVNMGHAATKDFYSAFGMFANGGYDVSIIKDTTLMGPMIGGGFRFWFLFNTSATFRFQHYFLNHGNSISLAINLGKYLATVKKNNKVSGFMKPYRK